MSRSNLLPFEILTSHKVNEAKRMKYRFLDLRNNKIRENIFKRHEIIKIMRNSLNDKGYIRVKDAYRQYGHVVMDFCHWLKIYAIDFKSDIEELNNYDDGKIYDFDKFIDLHDSQSYAFAVIEYISGMTDRKAIDEYNRIVAF